MKVQAGTVIQDSGTLLYMVIILCPVTMFPVYKVLSDSVMRSGHKKTVLELNTGMVEIKPSSTVQS